MKDFVIIDPISGEQYLAQSTTPGLLTIRRGIVTTLVRTITWWKESKTGELRLLVESRPKNMEQPKQTAVTIARMSDVSPKIRPPGDAFQHAEDILQLIDEFKA